MDKINVVAIKLNIIAFVLLTTPVIAQSDSTEIILDKYFENVGGKDSWKKITSLSTSETIIYQLGEQQRKAYNLENKEVRSSVFKAIKEPDLYYTHSVTDGVVYGTVFDGNTMMSILPTGDSLFYKAQDIVCVELKKKEMHFGEPWIIANAEEINYLGQVNIRNGKFYLLEVIKLGLSRYFYISKHEFLLEIVEINLPEGKSRTFFSDYRKIGSYLVPFRKSSFSDGILECDVMVNELNINAPINEIIFRTN